MAQQRMHIAQTVVFTDPRQVATVKVPAGHVILVLSRAVEPMEINVGEGTWQIDCPTSRQRDPKLRTWPVLMLVVPRLHAKSFINTAGMTKRIFQQLPAAGVSVSPPDVVLN